MKRHMSIDEVQLYDKLLCAALTGLAANPNMRGDEGYVVWKADLLAKEALRTRFLTITTHDTTEIPRPTW